MELGSDQSVKDTLASMERSRKRAARKNASAPARRGADVSASSDQGKTRPIGMKVRCIGGKCGTCWTCLGNAKWEKVFNEKFADPGYYKAVQPTRNGSSLSRVP